MCNLVTKAISWLANWQKEHPDAPGGACLGTVREALAAESKQIPAPMPRPNNTALANFRELVQDPAKWGWKQVHTQADGTLPVPCLVYFTNCGKEDGLVCGHICLFDGKTLWSDVNYKVDEWWMERIVGAFVPVD